MSEKVIKFPADHRRRMRKKMGKGYVPCMETERWLQFPAESSGYFDQGEFIEVSVMTCSRGTDEPRKICGLMITREDLMRALEAIAPPDADA